MNKYIFFTFFIFVSSITSCPAQSISETLSRIKQTEKKNINTNSSSQSNTASTINNNPSSTSTETKSRGLSYIIINSPSKDMHSDVVQLVNSIKKDFVSWMERGEFERKTDWDKRLKEQSQEKFDNLCKVALHSFINDDYSTNISKYDTENESFNITLIQNHNSSKTIIGQVKVPIGIAQNFKDNFRRYNLKNYKAGVNGNYLYPQSSQITYGNKTYFVNYNFSVIPAAISFDYMNINNPYLKGYIYFENSIESSNWDNTTKETRR